MIGRGLPAVPSTLVSVLQIAALEPSLARLEVNTTPTKHPLPAIAPHRISHSHPAARHIALTCSFLHPDCDATTAPRGPTASRSAAMGIGDWLSRCCGGRSRDSIYDPVLADSESAWRYSSCTIRVRYVYTDYPQEKQWPTCWASSRMCDLLHQPSHHHADSHSEPKPTSSPASPCAHSAPWCTRTTSTCSGRRA